MYRREEPKPGTGPRRKKTGADESRLPFEVTRQQNYWIGVPPDGVAASVPVEPIDDVPCQIVPVVFVKK